MWYIGQKVVCVNDDPGYYDGHKELVKGSVYEVIEIRAENSSYIGFKEELVVNDSRRLGWLSSRFRPLLDDSQEYADKLIKELETEINEENLILK